MSGFTRKTGLGKGLGALLTGEPDPLPQAREKTAAAERVAGEPGVQETGETGETWPARFADVDVKLIDTNPYQPRTEFDQVALHELAESIRVQGLIQPITVRRATNGRFELISGERRFRASKLAGLPTVPAYVREANDQQMLEMALIENIQRENLNSIEVALSFQRMLEECGLKQEQLGERVGKNRTTVNNYLRLLKLPPDIQAALRDQKLSMGHGRALLSVDEPEDQLWIFNQAIEKDLSVRKVEELARAMARGENMRTKVKAGATPGYRKIEDELGQKLRARVKVTVGSKGRGSIQIPFAGDEDLNRIIALLDW